MKKIKYFFILKIVLSLVLIVFSVIIISQLFKRTSDSIDKIADDFSKRNVVNEFYSYITKLEGTTRLQIASIKSLEKFSKKDQQSILWDLITLPDVVVELEVPVEYNYYIELKEKWEFTWNDIDSSVIVTAPNIKFN
jgi:hypothetical protein